MKKWVFSALFIFTLFIPREGFSSALCGSKDFDGISRECIAKSDAKLDEVKVSFNSLKNGSILYFLTSESKLGKIFVHSARRGRNGCQLNFDFKTYVDRRTYARSSTRTIRNKLGVWQESLINLDHVVNPSDLKITRQGKTCFLETDKGKLALIGKIKAYHIVSPDLIFYVGLLLIGFAFFNISRLIFEDENKYRSSEVIGQNDQNLELEENSSIILKYSTPFFRRYINPIVNGMKNKREIIKRYKKPLASAGVNKSLSAVDFYSFKLFSILTFPILYLVMRELMEADWSLSFTPLMAVLGYIYPDIWIKSKADARKDDVILNLPFALDMLALSVEAGLDFVAAMRKVLVKAPSSALTDEFEIVVKEIQLGSTRAQALKQMAWRVDSLPMTSFCATLIAADSVGASIGPILKSLSFEMRNKRSSLVEKKGAEAASKLLIPMVVFILPAIGVMIIGPMLLDFL